MTNATSAFDEGRAVTDEAEAAENVKNFSQNDGPADPMEIAPEGPIEPLEPKYKACERLRMEKRYEKFRKRQAYFRSVPGGRLSFTDSFYAALVEFPPLFKRKPLPPLPGAADGAEP